MFPLHIFAERNVSSAACRLLLLLPYGCSWNSQPVHPPTVTVRSAQCLYRPLTLHTIKLLFLCFNRRLTGLTAGCGWYGMISLISELMHSVCFDNKPLTSDASTKCISIQSLGECWTVRRQRLLLDESKNDYLLPSDEHECL